MKNQESIFEHSLHDIHGSIDTTKKSVGFKKIFSFIGPAYLVSVGYMDPGNWATDIAGGSKYGYSLIWVLLLSNLMAILLQSLSARLGIVRGRDLAQANREYFPAPINFILWLLAEIAIAATDLAEVLGMAIGLQLLFGLPLLAGVGITILDTFILLYLQKLGIRKIEAFIIVLIAIIGISFLFNILLSNPSLNEIFQGFIPSLPDAKTLYQKKGIIGELPDQTALYIAIGMIGATIMPHNLYLHSALIQTRKINKTNKGIKQALKWSLIDSSIALNVAFLINAAILILAATVFFKTGKTNVGEIKEAHTLLSPLLGNKIASTLFAIALIASGQSSTVTGTLSGQIVMEGYLQLRINPLARRFVTRLIAIIPALFFIYYSEEKNIDSLLILSQVILSLQLGFAIIPLIHFVSDKQTMKEFAVKTIVQVLAWLFTCILIGLNAKMLIDIISKNWSLFSTILSKFLIVGSCVFFIALLIYVIVFPLFNKQKNARSIEIHKDIPDINQIPIHTYNKIAIALDFSKNDISLISNAIGQIKKNGEIILIHIVESAMANLHRHDTADYETKQDQEKLDKLVTQLMEKGYTAKGILGYTHRAKEIQRIVEAENADMLVIGAHGHSGIRDFLYGSTIDKVRHQLKIPVFIVKV